MAKKNVSAAEVRAWGRENIANLPEAAHKCLGETARGRLHPDLVAAFTKASKGRKTYATGVAEAKTVTVPVTTLDKAGRKATRQVTMPTAEARAVLGHDASKRGPISKSDLSLALSAGEAAKVADSFK